MGELLIGGFIEGLMPEPRMTVTQWACKRRILSSKGSSEPGLYNVDRTPYLEEPMDNLSLKGNSYEKIIAMKGSQLGWSEMAFNLLGYIIDLVPCPFMYLMPTLMTMRRKVKQTVDPMIEDCPELKLKVGRKRSRDGGNTLDQKDFPGGTGFFGGANSAASLASVPVRVGIADEVDRYPDDVDDEGDPTSLLMRRMATFGAFKKLFMPSTPTIEGASRIEREFLLTDQRYYHVPCPHCYQEVYKGERGGLRQVLVREQLRWEKGRYDGVYYECIHCQGKIYNRDKTWMLRNERMGGTALWVPSVPENTNAKVVGYHNSSMYSPDGWLNWAEIAEEWDKSEGDEPKRKAVINTILGLTYKVKGDAPPWQMLFDRAAMAGMERNVVMEDVAFMTAGADVQQDRIEVEIVGWMRGRCSQQIDYRVYMGDTNKPEVWLALGELLNESWRVGQRKLNVRLMCVDANFNTPYVHDFCKVWGFRRVIPIQGRDALDMPFSTPHAVDKTKLGKNIGKQKVWGVGVSYLKTQLYGWLRMKVETEGDSAGVVPNGYCVFLPLEGHYFRGLTAEELRAVRSQRTNAVRYEWVKIYERNEPLDCRIYATAAAYMLGFERWSAERWKKEMMKSMSVDAGVTPEAPEVVDRPIVTGEANEPVVKAPVKGDAAPAKKKKSKGGFWD